MHRTTDHLQNQGRRRAISVLGLAAHNLTFQDVFALCFHLYMLARISIAPESHDQVMGQRFGLMLLTVSASTVLLVRGEILKPSRFRGALYRLGIVSPMVISYFQMRFVLAGIRPRLMDMQLWRIDEMLFGVTPAEWMTQFNTPAVVEWFAFFYYSYFWLMVLVIVPTLFFDKLERTRELMVGAVLVAGCGHILYTLVPGAGPHATIAFAEPVAGGFFWDQILATVDAGGALLDIFPSLHTAYPTLFALHVFAHRNHKPFKYLWPVVAIFAFHMVVATMLLRWHWGVDVLAGFALAIFARRVGVLVAQRESQRGITDDRQPVWEPLFDHQR